MKLLKGALAFVAIVFFGTIILGVATGGSRSPGNNEDAPTPAAVETQTASPQKSDVMTPTGTIAEEQAEVESTTSLYGIEDVNADGRQMVLGDKGLDKSGAVVCLPYVKRTSAIPTALGPVDDKVGAGNEVILGYFEFFNDGEKTIKVRPDDITCYADGVQVSAPDTFIKIESDGVKQFYSADLMSGTKVISVQEFVVPMGWNELKFFATDNCVWTVTQNDVTTADYNLASVFPTPVYDVTPAGSVIYSGDYDLIFDGMKYYTKDNMISEGQYLICKFQIKNTGSSALDMELVGHSMKAYIDGCFNDDQDFTLGDNIDGYTNVFDVDSIAPGMTSNIYVAFDILSRPENALIQYDDGYIFSGNVCYAYAHVD